MPPNCNSLRQRARAADAARAHAAGGEPARHLGSRLRDRFATAGILRDAAQAPPGTIIEARLAAGKIRAKVEDPSLVSLRLLACSV
jgi:hypothetical protein